MAPVSLVSTRGMMKLTVACLLLPGPRQTIDERPGAGVGALARSSRGSPVSGISVACTR